MNFSLRVLRSFSLPGILLLIACTLGILSCEDQKKSFTSDIVFPDSLISFTQYVEPLFRQTCVDGQCHGGTQPQAQLNLESGMWNSLMDHHPALIFVGNGNESLLLKRLDGRIPPQMPLENPLKANQINGVKKWIDEGAQFN